MTRLIDADALITAVLKNAIDYAVVFGNGDMHRLLVQIIAHQPTIDAEPVRHGKWIREVRYTIDSLHSYQQYRCSECGMTYITNTKYCPNCGARMDKDV